MPRNVSVELAEHIRGQLLTLATVVKITRLDGTIYGFTSHNKDVTFDGILYEKASALQLSAMRNATGTGVDNMDGMGLLNSNRIVDTDLLAGLYDGATCKVSIINYLDTTQGELILLEGTLGEVNFEDAQFHVEFRAKSQRLQQQFVELTSLTCRVQALGDLRCAPDGLIGGQLLSFYQRTGKLVGVVTSSKVFRIDAVTDISGSFDYGRALCTSGLNALIQREIKTSVKVGSNQNLVLQEGFPFAVQVGDAFTLEIGCDRTFGICKAKFANATNFRGEPFIPGTEQVLQRGRRG